MPNDPQPPNAPNAPGPPVARVAPLSTTHHGHTTQDPYAWLKDPNWQHVMREPDTLDPEIRAHLDAENAHTDVALASTADLQATLFDEMRGRIKEDDSSVPAPHGPWHYYQRYETGAQYPRYCRRLISASAAGPEQVLLDANAESDGKPFFRVAAVEHSPNHELLAVAIDENGSEYYDITLRRIDPQSNDSARLPDPLLEAVPDAAGEVEWAADNRSFFYTKLDDNHRPRWIYRHVLTGSELSTSDQNTPESELSASDQDTPESELSTIDQTTNGQTGDQDALVYAEPDPGFFVSLGRTESGRYILIECSDHETSETRLIDATQPDQPPALVAERDTGVLYSVAERNGTLIILTNAGGAEDFKIVTADPAQPDRDHWTDLVRYRPGVLILGLLAFAEHLVRIEMADALPRIVVRDLANLDPASDDEYTIAVDEEAFSLGLIPLYEFDATLRYTYSSPTTPLQVYDYDLHTRERTLRKEQEVPSGHHPADYVTRRIQAASPDGEQVPITILHRANTPMDGSAPCLLYGYGSYGMSMPAAFETSRLSLVDRGFVYAVAHIRGGKEGGYRWYTQGKREHKKNTFLDFIASAEALVQAGYTSPGGIAILGGSAGGMLVGATLNLAPHGLLGAAVAEVPFVDVLNTMLDADLPLTPPEWPEWGNPLEDPDAYDYIRSYSPYDNVEPRDYPPLLVTAGLTDPRVTYWEPAKWVARLRATKTGNHPLLLRTRMGAGHAGASGRFDHLKELAEVYAFLLQVIPD